MGQRLSSAAQQRAAAAAADGSESSGSGSPGRRRGLAGRKPQSGSLRVERMTETQLHEFREAFAQFDADHSGSIDMQELRQLCEWVGLGTSDSELEEMMALADGDQSGQIDFWEFATLMSHKMGDVHPDRTLQAAFRVFDTNGDGTLSADELRAVKMSVKLGQHPACSRHLEHDGAIFLRGPFSRIRCIRQTARNDRVKLV